MDAEWGALRRERARTYLEEIRVLKVRADGMASVVQSLRESAEGVKGMDYSKVMVSSSAYGDALPDAIASIEDAIQRHVSMLSEWTEKVLEAETILSSMESQELASVLERHYIMRHTVEMIAVELNYTTRAVDYKIAEGLTELYDLLPMEYRLPSYSAI